MFRAAISVLVVVVFPCLAPPVRAATAPRPNLEIVIVGEEVTCDFLSVAIAPVLVELESVTWQQMRETTPASGALLEHHPGVARIWIDAHRKGAVIVVGFSRNGSPRVRSADAPELTAVVAETVAQIVRETAVALLDEAAQTEAA